jgi:SAM-dependent methyltransferase
MWDQRYAEEGYAYGERPNDFLVDMLPSLPVGEALCLAEGEGRNAVFLANHDYKVTAVDQSETGLAKARDLARRHGVSLTTRQADLANFDLTSERWDVIVSIWAHLPSALRVPLHRQVVEGLRPGGALVLEAYTPDQLRFGSGGPGDIDMLMTLQALRQELVGLEFRVGREVEREVQEGKYHTGTSAVVQVLAFKPTL